MYWSMLEFMCFILIGLFTELLYMSESYNGRVGIVNQPEERKQVKFRH